MSPYGRTQTHANKLDSHILPAAHVNTIRCADGESFCVVQIPARALRAADILSTLSTTIVSQSHLPLQPQVLP
jgi:hypothetical protein